MLPPHLLNKQVADALICHELNISALAARSDTVGRSSLRKLPRQMLKHRKKCIDPFREFLCEMQDASEECEKSPLPVLMVEMIKLSGSPDSFWQWRKWKKS